ncbi:MFS transporter [Acutalibacter muris]|uniref:MFS transporter n=1 Tax=Acutalibacter muris TaxID=1796620 RepID=A0A1Z2XSE1_9FIRM|nr:MFS transporter [Acutalibacter muris]ANU55405.1 MFS transporter [Hungateiclostridiaceae bacterium KB18]ASB41360.1 MFS transporter [Acutalibacter muris]QQR30624.1 MFS transporter [Acutalibacter muris]
MNKLNIKSLRPYLLLWSTQSLSALGSSMTGYALVLWLYRESGSALETALLSVCSYAPYVLMSIFAGALSDLWDKKRTMLICDLLAAVSTVGVLFLLKTGQLAPWHMYLLNAVSGLMNTVQQPASEVAATLLVPKEHYQRTSGLRSLSGSLNTLLHPVLASALFAFSGMGLVIAVDLATFSLAFLTLLFFIRIPKAPESERPRESLLASAGEGLRWLRGDPLIMYLIFFLACINLVASAYNAALPALLLSRENGGETVFGLVNATVGAASLIGSAAASLLPASKDRVRAICLCLFLAMSTENFLLAFGRTPALWCLGAVLGWLPIPLMNAHMDVIFRTRIPAGMQGRVFSCRNTLQFFTIPVGYLLGGVLVDQVFEPLMSAQAGGLLVSLFGSGKGSGAALLFFVLGLSGVAVCLVFYRLLRRFRGALPRA